VVTLPGGGKAWSQTSENILRLKEVAAGPPATCTAAALPTPAHMYSSADFYGKRPVFIIRMKPLSMALTTTVPDGAGAHRRLCLLCRILESLHWLDPFTPFCSAPPYMWPAFGIPLWTKQFGPGVVRSVTVA